MHHIYPRQPLCARLQLGYTAPSSITKRVIMIRLLMWVALIAAVIWFVKRLINPPKPKTRPASPEIDAAPMVRCAHCGVHSPRDRALSQGQQWYCSEAHRLQGPAARDR
ncbi:hypothetical protein NLO74_23215 [Pseudomonas tremae]|uniref:MYND finger n=3 Tax=Pseudomonas syringae group TaxID=136849 RepID=A0AAE6QLV8_9PSED|nr:hypothetical protein OA77_03380 [Pseudomonas coronafaciens]KOP51776.1 hypothetical protein OX88_25175 [Pseudomonas coronafaciens pv. porri]MCF5744869.1 hypothetical protein [Pseudomonas tremae]QGL58641.1 hypothetical protein POR16_21010 [Pseudomonas coronafaciens pv. oryzae str. 1_6]QGT83677.1 hypothetical protein GMO17_22195 [Pseudomonas coronafaciens pv. coronafaciens]